MQMSAEEAVFGMTKDSYGSEFQQRQRYNCNYIVRESVARSRLFCSNEEWRWWCSGSWLIKICVFFAWEMCHNLIQARPIIQLINANEEDELAIVRLHVGGVGQVVIAWTGNSCKEFRVLYSYLRVKEIYKIEGLCFDRMQFKVHWHWLGKYSISCISMGIY